MPKICKDYPNCLNTQCGFSHPVILAQEKEELAHEEKLTIVIPCQIYRRKNLGIFANTVRGAVFSIVKGLTEPFESLQLAKSWICEHGDKDYVYQIRHFLNSQTLEYWVFDSAQQWHITQFRQDQTRGYRSDKHPNLRIH